MEMVQNSDSWHEWRNAGIGSSDAPIIMGNSDYSTPFKLWQLKTGKVKDDFSGNFATELGSKYEEVARSQYFFDHQTNFEPACVEHADYPFLRASLDGALIGGSVFCEIKYMGQKNFDWVKANKAPLPNHVDQIQHQFLVTGYERCVYIVYTLTPEKNNIQDICYVDVLPDREYIEEKLAPKLLEFWNFVQTDTPPPFSDGDVYKDENEGTVLLVALWRKYKAELKDIEEKIALAEETLKFEAKDYAKYECDGLKITRTERVGAVDYSRVPALANVNLDDYRKPSTVSFTIKDGKK